MFQGFHRRSTGEKAQPLHFPKRGKRPARKKASEKHACPRFPGIPEKRRSSGCKAEASKRAAFCGCGFSGSVVLHNAGGQDGGNEGARLGGILGFLQGGGQSPEPRGRLRMGGKFRLHPFSIPLFVNNILVSEQNQIRFRSLQGGSPAARQHQG